jgi:N-acetylglucosamine-6-sulfatase
VRNVARSVLLVAVLLVFGLVLSSCQEETETPGLDSPSTRDEPSGAPNIIFIITDDQDARSVEYMPELKALLAEEGTTFGNAYVTHSLCCPSRASILRGQYTHNHRVLTNGGGPYYKGHDPYYTDYDLAPDNSPFGGFEKFHNRGYEESNVATWLKSGGYRTVLIGKYLNGYPKQPNSQSYPEGIQPTYVPPGWDEWYGHIEEGILYYNYRLNENGDIVSYSDDEEDYETDVLARKAIEYVRRTADDPQPFFMYLAPNTPHDPFIPAPRHEEQFPGTKAPQSPSFNEPDVSDKPSWLRERFLPLSSLQIAKIDIDYRARLQMLLAVDEMISDLVQALEEGGKLENTYIVFTSDNGWHQGEHRRSRGKGTAYEEDIRVPLIVRGPGVPAGRTLSQLALNIDFAPTFAELAGVTVPSFVDGRSLVPLLTGDASSASWRSTFLLEWWNEHIYHSYMVPSYKGLHTSDHVYVKYASGDRELYDLRADPYEVQNLYETADPALVTQLESWLEALSDCAGETCRVAEDAQPVIVP